MQDENEGFNSHTFPEGNDVQKILVEWEAKDLEAEAKFQEWRTRFDNIDNLFQQATGILKTCMKDRVQRACNVFEHVTHFSINENEQDENDHIGKGNLVKH